MPEPFTVALTGARRKDADLPKEEDDTLVDLEWADARVFCHMSTT